MNTPNLDSLNKNTIREKYISINYPEFHEYIIEHYPKELKWTEKLYWYYNGLTEKPVCVVCGNPVRFINIKEGYRKYCSIKCNDNSKETKEKRKYLWVRKYGVEHPSQSPSIKEKKKQTVLEHFGVNHPSQANIIKEKKKQTTLSHYGVENPFQSDQIKEKIKETCLKKYGAENPSKSQEIINKIISKSKQILEKTYITKKKNHSFNSSKIEEDFANWLSSNNIPFKRQYRSEKYPFSCDFYFPDKDMYLEIQGSWTHGDHPFDPNNDKDKMILEEMRSKHTEYYENAINVWTIKDPLKRSIAKENGLNWCEVFSCDLNDVIGVYKSF